MCYSDVGENETVSSAFYEARQNVLDTYVEAENQFSSNIWNSPRLLFSYFKRPIGEKTEKLVYSADIFSHTLELLAEKNENRHRTRRRVSLTDSLTQVDLQNFHIFGHIFRKINFFSFQVFF